LSGLGEEDSPLRARLLARLSLELYYAGQPERRMVLSGAAVQIARRIEDPATLAVALDARHYVLWRPENAEERLAVAGEVRPRTPCTTSRWRCSTSAASRGGSPRSRTRSASSSRSTRRSRRGAARWRWSTSSSGGTTRRARRSRASRGRASPPCRATPTG